MKYFLGLVIAMSIGAEGSDAQTTSTTRPCSFSAVKALGNSDTRFSASAQRGAVFQGSVLAVAGKTVTVQGADPFMDCGCYETPTPPPPPPLVPVLPEATPNAMPAPQQFVYAAGTQPNTYRLEFISGAKAGLYFMITGNTVNAVTLNLEGENIDAEGGVQPGDGVRIIPYWTLNTLFPGQQGISTSSSITGTGSVTQVLMPNLSAAGINQPPSATYFYYSGTDNGGPGWRQVGGSPTAIMDDTVILPDQFVILRQQGVATNQVFASSGFVATNTRRYVVSTLQPGTPQDNALAMDLGYAATLAQSNLIGGGTMAGTASTSGTNCDQLLVWDDTVPGMNKNPAKTYFYYNGTASGGPGWRLAGDAATNIHDNEAVFTPGSGFVIRKLATTSPALLTWALPSMYDASLMITPLVATKLPSTTTTFNWASVSAATQYTLWIGSSVGAKDLDSSVASGQNLSRTATLPFDGRPLYATLRALVNGVWQSYAYSYSAAQHAWHRAQITALTNPALANMADGARTGAAQPNANLYFYKGTDNNIWAVFLAGNTWGQQQLTTLANVSDWLAYDPAFSTLNYQGTDGNLWCVYYDSKAAKWTSQQLGALPQGVTITGDIVVDNYGGWNNIYYRGSDSHLYAVYFNGSAWVHVAIGGTATVKGSLAIQGNNHLVYYQSTDNNLWCFYYNGKVWAQLQLTTTGNVAGTVAVDNVGFTVYYKSNVDNSAWCGYSAGGPWTALQLDTTANLSASATSFSNIAPYPLNDCTVYLDNNGQCESLYFNGSQWTHAVLGDGGSSITGGLSLQVMNHWLFARRSDGNVIIFYIQ